MDKVVLMLMQILPLYVCGIDRCYMGSYGTGILKGMTLGGLGIWVIIDWLIFIPNAIEGLTTIDSMGVKATFSGNSLAGGHWLGYLAVVAMVLKMAATAVGGTSITNMVKGRHQDSGSADEEGQYMQ